MRRYFFLLFLAGNALFAQNHLQIQKDTVRVSALKPATVVGRLAANFSMPMVVVDSATIRQNSFATPADALQRQAGISLSRDGAWATSVNVRGLSEQRLIFTVDGDRIQTSSDIAAALSTVDMNCLAKIEVVKGAASVLYGSGAMGGIVNFVSALPSYSKFFAVSGNAGSGVNSVNGLWANHAAVNFTTQQWYVALTGSYRTAGNMHTPAYRMDNKSFTEIPGSQFNDASWGLKAGVKYAPDQEFRVNYQNYRAWNTGISGVAAVRDTFSLRYKKVVRSQLNAEYVFSDVNDYLTQLSIKAYTQSVSRDVEINPTPDKVGYPQKKLFPSSSNDTYGAKVTSEWELERRHSLIAGAEGWLRKSATSRLIILQTSDVMSTYRGEQPVADARQLDLGAFAYYTFKIIPSKLFFNAGLRADYIRTENDSAFNPLFVYTVNNGTQTDMKPQRALLFVKGHQHEGSYAAHFDLKYYLSAAQSLSFSVANSYRTASIDERFKYIDLGASAAVKVGNPDLKPERGTFADINYTLATGKVLFKTDFYCHYLFDLIAEKPGTFKGHNALINTNINKAMYVGGEFDARWFISRRWSATANASYVYTRDVDANQPLPQIPPMTGFVEVNYRIAKVMNAALSSKWAAAQNDVAPGESATAGYAVFNMNVNSCPIAVSASGSALRFFAGIDNMLNKAYYNHLTTVRLAGEKYYEPGRNFWVKANLTF